MATSKRIIKTEIKSKKDLGFEDNKSIPIQSIAGIVISKFRSFAKQKVVLGSQVTLLVGRNGTMKTSLMGLIAHPFSSTSKDAFGRELKTTLQQVFRFSEVYDTDQYSYSLYMKVVGKTEFLKEDVKVYYVANETNRHRVVVSGSEKGDGNFNYNTSFLNLKRLLPLVDTKAIPDADQSLQLSAQEQQDQKDFYERIFPSSEYGEFAPIHQRGLKTTFAPTGATAKYDYRSISSGEDNLGAIFNRLIGFQRAFDPKAAGGNGILCIDEFESGLHPIAQLSLFRYLQRWSDKYKVQVVITTHSLHLIQDMYLNRRACLDAKRIVINFVSCATAGDDKNYPILQNPDYDLAFKELTLESPMNVLKSQKIDVFCEDEIAVHFVKRLVKKSEILDLISFHTNLDQDAKNQGTPYLSLVNLCKNFSLLLKNAFVIFDADVLPAATKGIPDNSTHMTLPDADGLALERRIVYYIGSLPNDHEFFRKFKNEKLWFLNKFKAYDIGSLTLEEIKKNEKKVPISQCKNWAKSDSSAFKKYVTYYCQQLEGREAFVADFVAKINVINQRKGLPLISHK